jgi:hypothetical protein
LEDLFHHGAVSMNALASINTREQAINIILGYQQMIQERVVSGWRPFLMTFMFKPLPGEGRSRAQQMFDEVDRVYSTFVTRVVRRPRREAMRTQVMKHFHDGYVEDGRPLLVACLDGYCRKPHKREAVTGQHNDGEHVHAILVVSSANRLKCQADEHFAQHKSLYEKNRLLRLDIRPIKTDLATTIDYGLKGLKSGVATSDDIIVLPKALSQW